MPAKRVGEGATKRESTLELIDLDQLLPGQRQFVSRWLVRQPGLTFIVDPGPRSTAGRLVARLQARSVDESAPGGRIVQRSTCKSLACRRPSASRRTT
jgi:hypothetical protein